LTTGGYQEMITTPNYNRNNSHSRRPCSTCMWASLICFAIILVVLVVLILVGANVIPPGKTLEAEQFSEMPLLLNLSLPLECTGV